MENPPNWGLWCFVATQEVQVSFLPNKPGRYPQPRNLYEPEDADSKNSQLRSRLDTVVNPSADEAAQRGSRNGSFWLTTPPPPPSPRQEKETRPIYNVRGLHRFWFAHARHAPHASDGIRRGLREVEPQSGFARRDPSWGYPTFEERAKERPKVL